MSNVIILHAPTVSVQSIEMYFFLYFSFLVNVAW